MGWVNPSWAPRLYDFSVDYVVGVSDVLDSLKYLIKKHDIWVKR